MCRTPEQIEYERKAKRQTLNSKLRKSVNRNFTKLATSQKSKVIVPFAYENQAMITVEIGIYLADEIQLIKPR